MIVQTSTLENISAYTKYFEPEMLSDVGQEILETLKRDLEFRKTFLAGRLRSIKSLQPEMEKITAIDIEYLVGIPNSFLERAIHDFCLEYHTDFNIWVKWIIDKSCKSVKYRANLFSTREGFFEFFAQIEAQLSASEISRFWGFVGNESAFEGKNPKQLLQDFEAKKLIERVDITDFPHVEVYSYAEIVETKKRENQAIEQAQEEREKELREERQQRNRTRLIKPKQKNYRDYTGQKTFVIELEKRMLGEGAVEILERLEEDIKFKKKFFSGSRLLALKDLKPNLTPQDVPYEDMVYLIAVQENLLGKKKLKVTTPCYMGRWGRRLLKIGCNSATPLREKFFEKGSDFLASVGAFEDKLSPADIALFWSYVGEEQIGNESYKASLEALTRQRLHAQMGKINLFSVPKLVGNEKELEEYLQGGGEGGYFVTDKDLSDWIKDKAIVVGIILVGTFVLAGTVTPTGITWLVGVLLLGLYIYISIQDISGKFDARDDERQEMKDKGLY